MGLHVLTQDQGQLSLSLSGCVCVFVCVCVWHVEWPRHVSDLCGNIVRSFTFGLTSLTT